MNQKDKEVIDLETPLSRSDVEELETGDLVQISGTIVTARDKAYSKILEILRNGGDLPIDLGGGVVYHCGPLIVESGEGWEVVAAGPTTSARMDSLEREFVSGTGVRGLIGKGGVSVEAGEAISDLDCVYFAYTGGAAALAADSIVSVEDLFWEGLGLPEAMWVLEVDRFGPLLVGVDVSGESLYR